MIPVVSKPVKPVIEWDGNVDKLPTGSYLACLDGGVNKFYGILQISENSSFPPSNRFISFNDEVWTDAPLKMFVIGKIELDDFKGLH